MKLLIRKGIKKKVLETLSKQPKFDRRSLNLAIGLSNIRRELQEGWKSRKGGQKTRQVNKKTPFIHRQFDHAMLETVKPILLKSVAAGELDIVECGKLETAINRSIQNPFFQIDRKYLDFLNKKLKSNGYAALGGSV